MGGILTAVTAEVCDSQKDRESIEEWLECWLTKLEVKSLGEMEGL